jgi:pimeloyl-ACP methyl ester carboxylesterase
MTTVTSPDGSSIAFDHLGTGRPVICIDGALCSRQLGPFPVLARALAERFDVIHHDRRGRGESTDRSAGTFDIDREVEDVAALVDHVGGTASLVGMSSGGVLALEAANRVAGIERVVVYEAPLVTDPAHRVPADFATRMRRHIADDEPGAAVRFFLRTVGMPAPMVELMRMTPAFGRLKRTARTLPYDAELIMAALGTERTLRTDRWSSVTAQVTVLAGAKSPEHMRRANADLADVLGAEHRLLAGQNHMVKGTAIAPALIECLGATRSIGL